MWTQTTPIPAAATAETPRFVRKRHKADYQGGSGRGGTGAPWLWTAAVEMSGEGRDDGWGGRPEGPLTDDGC